ncbi:MAG TPA: polysaccharide deacetylase family protein [Gammaproteobacteria bacterium]
MSKQAIKRLLRRGLSVIGPERFRNRAAYNLVILMYHRVLPENHPDRDMEQPGMFVSPEAFEMQMRLLKSRFELVRLSDWVRAARAGARLPKFACAVTFDDGWRDNYDYAYPILRKYGIPATIFVVSRFVGTRYSFWPNRIMRLICGSSLEERKALLQCEAGRWLKDVSLGFSLLDAYRMNQTQLDELVQKCKPIPEDKLLERLDELEAVKTGRVQTAGVDMMDWDQLKAMQSGGLIDVGSHTCRHKRLLKGMPLEVMRDEIEISKTEIERRLNMPVESFCYPNGDYTDEAIEYVRRYYAFACTTKCGWNSQKDDFMQLKRIGVHEDVAADRHAFLARLTGWI